VIDFSEKGKTIAFLKRIPLFSGLTEEELEEIVHIFKENFYKKNEVIFREEDTGKHMYIVKFGKVKVVQTSKFGKENIVAIHNEGDTFGELSLIDGKTMPATVLAMEDCKIISVDANYFRNVLLQNKKILNNLINVLCQKLRTSFKLMKILKYTSAFDRVKYLLADFGKINGYEIEDGIKINIKITHQEIAELVGISRETASRTISKLQSMGKLEVKEHYFILKDREFWQV